MKILKISDIFELENIGYISPIYIMDIYRAYPGLRQTVHTHLPLFTKQQNW